MAAAASSSGAGVTARGIRILDSPRERRSPPAPWVSLGVDGFHGEVEDDDDDAPLPRARGCDVYVGYGDGVRRMAAWLRAELEMLGVPCAAPDRRRRGHTAAARAAMDAATVGVVVVTPASLASPHAVEEIRAFLSRGALVPVFVGVTRRDVAVAEDVVEGRGHLWGAHGGELWNAYGGDEAEWRDAVEGIAGVEPAVEVRAGDLRGGVFDALEILGARLGRRAVAPAVAAWRAAADTEIPLQWNPGFVGREMELVELESTLRGGARALNKAAGKRPVDLEYGGDDVSEGRFMDCVAVCVTGASGAGKTELALEFAHRHAHEYKRVLWVHGEARYLRQSYLNLADHLGIAVGDTVSPSSANRPARTSRRLHEIEGDAIAKIKKELTRDIPYLLIIDNLESERDWWDRRPFKDLLPLGARRTHVIITTRLAGLRGTTTLELGNLDGPNAMRLMQGTSTCSDDDMAVLAEIHERVRGVALGLALVGAIVSEADIGPSELRDAMNDAPHRAPTWASNDDPTLRDNPGLVQLLDACFALAGGRDAAAGLERLLEAGSFFAPAPIPTAMLLRAAAGTSPSGETLWRRFKRTVTMSCASPHTASHGQDALAALLRLGIARRSTRAGCVSVHAVFRLFSRKVGSGRVARAVVQAVAAEGGGGAARHGDHTWAACTSLFRFGAPAVLVKLPPMELVSFVTRCVLPLASRCVAGYSAYSAALELLREATDGVLEAEDRYIGSSPRRSNGSSYVELDPKVYQSLARTRAELLVTRARMMVRAGERDIAEDHCLSAISILEVVSGDCHPETLAVRAFLEEAVRL